MNSKTLEALNIPTPTPIKFYCDNKAAIYIARNLIPNDITKHNWIGMLSKKKLRVA